MKKKIIVVILFFLLGCSEKIDGSSEKNFNTSIKKIESELSQEKKNELEEAIMYFQFSDEDYIKKLNGKTIDDVLAAYRDASKNEEKKINEQVSSQEQDQRYLDYPVEYSQNDFPLTCNGVRTMQGQPFVVAEIPVFGRMVTPRELFHSNNLISKPTKGLQYPFKKGDHYIENCGTEKRLYLVSKAVLDRIEVSDESRKYYLTVSALLPEKASKEIKEQVIWKFRIQFTPDHDDKRNYITYLRAKSMITGTVIERSHTSLGNEYEAGEMTGLFISLADEIFDLNKIHGKKNKKKVSNKTDGKKQISSDDSSSSSLNGKINSIRSSSFRKKNPPELMLDEDDSTAWNSNGDIEEGNASIEIEFDSIQNIETVVMEPWRKISKKGIDLFKANARIKRLSLQFDDGSTESLYIANDQPNVTLSKLNKRSKKVEIGISEIWPGAKWQDICISEIKIFGKN